VYVLRVQLFFCSSHIKKSGLIGERECFSDWHKILFAKKGDRGNKINIETEIFLKIPGNFMLR